MDEQSINDIFYSLNKQMENLVLLHLFLGSFTKFYGFFSIKIQVQTWVFLSLVSSVLYEPSLSYSFACFRCCHSSKFL